MTELLLLCYFFRRTTATVPPRKLLSFTEIVKSLFIIIIQNYKCYLIAAWSIQNYWQQREVMLAAKWAMTSVLPCLLFPFHNVKDTPHLLNLLHMRACEMYCASAIVIGKLRKAYHPPPTIPFLGSVYQFTLRISWLCLNSSHIICNCSVHWLLYVSVKF